MPDGSAHGMERQRRQEGLCRLLSPGDAVESCRALSQRLGHGWRSRQEEPCWQSYPSRAAGQNHTGDLTGTSPLLSQLVLPAPGA